MLFLVLRITTENKNPIGGCNGQDPGEKTTTSNLDRENLI